MMAEGGADLARWMHHSRRVAGRHLHGVPRERDLPNLLFAPNLSRKVMQHQEYLSDRPL
jgi:hypothetical protein